MISCEGYPVTRDLHNLLQQPNLLQIEKTMFVRIDPGLRSRRVIAHVKAGLICSSGESSNWTRQQAVFDFKTISSGCIAMQVSAELKKRSENARNATRSHRRKATKPSFGLVPDRNEAD